MKQVHLTKIGKAIIKAYIDKYGFNITRILLVPHGGWHNDTICTVEVKRKQLIKLF
jgi:hypothetical protein